MRLEKVNKTDRKELTKLTKLSKAYWGYGPEQIKKWEDDLTITQNYIAQNDVIKLISEERIIGYYSYFKLDNQTVKLDNLFILPDFIGKGLGTLLMSDFFARVNNEGFKKITLDSEPNAEKFYEAFGFSVVGKLKSSIKDRFLPVMEKEI